MFTLTLLANNWIHWQTENRRDNTKFHSLFIYWLIDCPSTSKSNPPQYNRAMGRSFAPILPPIWWLHLMWWSSGVYGIRKTPHWMSKHCLQSKITVTIPQNKEQITFFWYFNSTSLDIHNSTIQPPLLVHRRRAAKKNGRFLGMLIKLLFLCPHELLSLLICTAATFISPAINWD